MCVCVRACIYICIYVYNNVTLFGHRPELLHAATSWTEILWVDSSKISDVKILFSVMMRLQVSINRWSWNFLCHIFMYIYIYIYNIYYIFNRQWSLKFIGNSKHRKSTEMIPACWNLVRMIACCCWWFTWVAEIPETSQSTLSIFELLTCISLSLSLSPLPATPPPLSSPPWPPAPLFLLLLGVTGQNFYMVQFLDLKFGE